MNSTKTIVYYVLHQDINFEPKVIMPFEHAQKRLKLEMLMLTFTFMFASMFVYMFVYVVFMFMFVFMFLFMFMFVFTFTSITLIPHLVLHCTLACCLPLSM